MNRVSDVLAVTYRGESAKLIAFVMSMVRDLDRAEDIVQEVATRALMSWERRGIPDRPGAWLATACRNLAVDQLRQRRRWDTGHQKLTNHRIALAESLAAYRDDLEPIESYPDERLRLIFTCCHPSLSTEAQVALTLRTVCSLTTGEIAAAFLIKETTMAQRLVRAKRKISVAKIPYQVPDHGTLHERLKGVLATLYLVFNQGYHPPAGRTIADPRLSRESIRLARLVDQLLPEQPEVLGLLALMLLHDARRASRLNAKGELVLLADQNRALWLTEQISEGEALVERALSMGQLGPYQLQAAIAALHAQAPSAEATDWAQIAALYSVLHRIHPSPVVLLNRAVAIAMSDGTAAGLSAVESLSDSLSSYPLYHSARADLLRRLGHLPASIKAYQRAASLAQNETELAFYVRRIDELTGGTDQR